MLVLIGTVPTAYALNHAVGYNQVHASRCGVVVGMLVRILRRFVV